MKKIIVSSILSLVMCTSALVGATFSLFTSESSKNVAINSGKVDVVATLESLELYSPTLIDTNGDIIDANDASTESSFKNGGSAVIKEESLILSNVTPGDKATFTIKITNNSSVAVKYRTATTVTNDDGLFNGLNVQIDSTTYNGNSNYSNWGVMTVDEKTKTIDCVVELPAKADKTYMDKTCTIAFTVEAVQGNVMTYNTTDVSTQEGLSSAIAAANSPTEITLASGTYSNFQNLYGSMAGKELVLSGTENTIIDVTSQQHVAGVADLKDTTITFDGVTVNWRADETYQGLKNPKKVVYKNCKINGLQYMYGDAEFINCTFTNMDCWSVWTYGAENVDFIDCTFITGGHAVLLYNEGNAELNFENHVNFNNCTFLSADTVGAPWGVDEQLVEVGDDSNNTNKYNLTFTDCTYYSTLHELHGNKNNIPEERLIVTETGTKHIENVYASTQETLEKVLKSEKLDSVPVKLASGTYSIENFYGNMTNEDITLYSTEGAVIDVSNQVGVNGVADLTNTTITFDGLTVKWSNANDGYQGLKNPKHVVYKNCTIIGTQFMYSGADFINCTFKTGDGYAVYTRASGDYTFTNCNFITGGRAIMMYHDGAINVNITLTGCTFSDDGTYTSKDKAVVETGNGGSASKYNIVINDCEILKGFEANNSSSALWGNKDNMTAENLTVKINNELVYGTEAE